MGKVLDYFKREKNGEGSHVEDKPKLKKERVKEFLDNNVGKWFNTTEISEATGVPKSSVSSYYNLYKGMMQQVQLDGRVYLYSSSKSAAETLPNYKINKVTIKDKILSLLDSNVDTWFLTSEIKENLNLSSNITTYLMGNVISKRESANNVYYYTSKKTSTPLKTYLSKYRNSDNKNNIDYDTIRNSKNYIALSTSRLAQILNVNYRTLKKVLSSMSKEGLINQVETYSRYAHKDIPFYYINKDNIVIIIRRVKERQSNAGRVMSTLSDTSVVQNTQNESSSSKVIETPKKKKSFINRLLTALLTVFED